MLTLTNDNLNFSFPDVHENAQMSINLQRTIRIPDDGKSYNLPPGLGRFPVKMVDDPKFRSRVPAKWLEHGGVMLPMFQAEAMWIAFNGHHVTGRKSAYPFAVKVSAGMKSAITGETRAAVLKEKDYVVIPTQPWLDGFVTEKGKIRQFVAAPLGMGFTAEEQLSGKAEFGGLQIEIFPMKAEVYEKRFPYTPPVLRSNGMKFAAMEGGYGTYFGDGVLKCAVACAAGPAAAEMGLGAGGTMSQQIYDDPFDFDDWDRTKREKVFIHLANSLAWQAITGYAPPPTPADAKAYASYGYPWFDYYRDDIDSLEATDKLKGLKSILELGFQKGSHILPTNESVDVPDHSVVTLTKKSTPNEVTTGDWGDEKRDG